jgi:hypothetical protein
MTNKETTGLLNKPALEPVSIKGFIDFLKNNLPLVIAVSVAAVFIGGARIVQYGGIMDNILLMTNQAEMYKVQLLMGRFGQVLLGVLSYRVWTPYTQVFAAAGLLWCAALSWCYIIAIFSNNIGKDNRFIPFALLFLSSNIFTDQFLYTFMVLETISVQALCPYVVYLFYHVFLDNQKKKTALAFVLLVFMISVYQSGAFVFCCGAFVCFLVLQERTVYEPKIYSRLCLKLFFALILAVALNLIINNFLGSILKIEAGSYIKDYIKWFKRPLIETILAILLLGYILTIGNIPFVQQIVYPMIEGLTKLPEAPSILKITDSARTYSNILLLPAAVLFLILIAKKAGGQIPKGRRLLYVLAGIGVPFSIIAHAVILGSVPGYRALWAAPLAAAFMCFYLIKTWKKKAAFVLSFLVLIISARQMQTSSLAFYTDKVQYEEEVRLAADLNRLIQDVQPETGKLPVAMVGGYDFLVPNVILTEVALARSFAFSGYSRLSVPLIFMNHLGWQYDIVDDSQWKMILAEAASMPSYPDSSSVQRRGDVIVVKLSDDHEAQPYAYGESAHLWLGR